MRRGRIYSIALSSPMRLGNTYESSHARKSSEWLGMSVAGCESIGVNDNKDYAKRIDVLYYIHSSRASSYMIYRNDTFIHTKYGL